jgi:predicted lipoprotein with Yx(FWY)xxD motif
MNRIRSIPLLTGAAVTALAALAVAGCGGGGGNSGGNAAAAAPRTTTGASATVGVAKTNLGRVLVDSKGRTLYLFKKDQGTKSTCFGECATDWPPLRVSGKPTVGSGAQASMVSTSARPDGPPQVTYNGHPLYRFEGDHKPGDTTGQGVNAFGAAWYALTPAGDQVSGNASSSGGSGGY